MKRYNKPRTLFGLGFVKTIPRHLAFLGEVCLANHLASTDNLTRTTNRQKHRQINDT